MTDRDKPVTGEIYHVYNRGVEKRKIFVCNKDKERFLIGLSDFNKVENKTSLVKILSFALMDNHYHLMLQQVVDGGITEFIRKVSTGYTNYFNIKYERVGPLFQGRYRRVLVDSESHLQYLPFYIHLNPLDMFNPKWRETTLSNNETKLAMKFLQTYRWSSHLDYSGVQNFVGLVNGKLVTEILGDNKEYLKDVSEWLIDEERLDISSDYP